MWLKQLNCFGIIQGEDAGTTILSIVQVHCITLPWVGPEDKRFIIVLHKLGNKFTMIYWLNIWTWLQQRSRLESCMAGFGLGAEMNDTVLVRLCIHVLVFEFVCVCVHKAGECSLFNITRCCMLIPQQWAVPKGKIISYSDPGSAIGILTTQQIKKEVCLCCFVWIHLLCVWVCVCVHVCAHLHLCFFALSEFFGCHLSLTVVCVQPVSLHTE